MLTLEDLYGKKLDEMKVVGRIRELCRWIEKSPLSSMPFVEMGFDTLNQDLMQKLDMKKNDLQRSERYQAIKLKCRPVEQLAPNFLYQENFPYWSQPFSAKTVDDYNVGDRVININSTRREYVPFGLRGTVVGKTNDKVVVLFDEQYLGGSNIHGHC